MARKNLITQLHPEVQQDISSQLARGISKASISRQYGHLGVNKDILLNFERGELSPRLASAWRTKAEKSSVSVLDEMSTLLDETRDILRDALDKGHNSLALKAVGQIRNNLELVARIQHAIAQQQAQELTTIELREDSQGNAMFMEGYKLLPRHKQNKYMDLVMEALSLSNGIGEDQREHLPLSPSIGSTEEDLSRTTSVLMPQNEDEGLVLDQDDFSLKPRQVPRRKTAADQDPEKPTMRRTRH